MKPPNPIANYTPTTGWACVVRRGFLAALGVLLLLAKHTAAQSALELPAFEPHEPRRVDLDLEPLRELYRSRGGQNGAFRVRYNANSSERVEVSALALSKDGRYAFSGGEREVTGRSTKRTDMATARMWNLQTGEEVRRFVGHPGAEEITSIAVSPDLKYVATCAKQQTRLWDLNTGEELYCWKKIGWAAVFTHDSTRLITSGYNGVVSLDLRTKQAAGVYRLSQSGYGVPYERRLAPIIFPDSRSALIIAKGEASRLDLQSGKSLIAYQGSDSVDRVAISPRGNLVAGADEDRLIVWDARTGQEVRRFTPAGSRPLLGAYVLYFSGDGRRISVIARRGHRQTWELETGLLVSRTHVGEGSLCVSLDRRLMLRANDAHIDLMENDTTVALARFHVFRDNRHWMTESVDGSYSASDEHQALIGLDPTLASRGLTTSPERLARQLTALTHGERAGVAGGISVRAETSDGPNATGRMFVLAVGVSDYKYPEYNLDFADNDAKALIEFFRSQKGRLHADVVVQEYTNRNASRDRLASSLDWLQRSCTPADTAIVLFAGHGIRGRRGLYFVTHEGDTEGIQYTCLNWSEVAQRLANTDAGQVLFLSDCCHAGSFAEKHIANQEDLAREFSNKGNVVFFASCQPNESAFEQENWKLSADDRGHGAFTYALIEGFRGAADAGEKDKNITLEELYTYVRGRVAELTGGEQQPEIHRFDASDQDRVLSVSP